MAIADELDVILVVPAFMRPMSNWKIYTRALGQPDKGEEFARRALAVAPRDAAVKDTLGWALLQQGNPEALTEAVELLRQASLRLRTPDSYYHYAMALAQDGDWEGAQKMVARTLRNDAAFADRDKAQRFHQEVTTQLEREEAQARKRRLEQRAERERDLEKARARLAVERAEREQERAEREQEREKKSDLPAVSQ